MWKKNRHFVTYISELNKKKKCSYIVANFRSVSYNPVVTSHITVMATMSKMCLHLLSVMGPPDTLKVEDLLLGREEYYMYSEKRFYTRKQTSHRCCLPYKK